MPLQNYDKMPLLVGLHYLIIKRFFSATKSNDSPLARNANCSCCVPPLFCHHYYYGSPSKASTLLSIRTVVDSYLLIQAPSNGNTVLN